MANRLFVGSVIIVWLTSMSWLVVDKVLPSFYQSRPPLTESYDTGQAIAWRVHWSGDFVGRAASLYLPGASGTNELHNRVMLEGVPLLELAPSWMRHVVGDIGKMDIDAVTRIEFDSLDFFSSFDSRVAVNDIASVLRMSGRVKDSYLELTVRSGDLSYSTEFYTPDHSALSETLFPVGKLPYMYVGRRWQEKTYSPFRAPNLQVETVHAEVVSKVSIEFDGEQTSVLRIDYRGISQPGMSESSRLQAIAWVRPTGEVLRQEVYVGNSRLRFDRMTEEESAEVGAEFFEREIHNSRWHDQQVEHPERSVPLRHPAAT